MIIQIYSRQLLQIYHYVMWPTKEAMDKYNIIPQLFQKNWNFF